MHIFQVGHIIKVSSEDSTFLAYLYTKLKTFGWQMAELENLLLGRWGGERDWPSSYGHILLACIFIMNRIKLLYI